MIKALGNYRGFCAHGLSEVMMRVSDSFLFRDVAPTIEEDMASKELLDLAPMIAANAKIAREVYSEKLREKGRAGADEQYDDYVGDDGYDDDGYDDL